MGRNSKRVALYEVISKNRLKSSQEKVLEKERLAGEDKNKVQAADGDKKKSTCWPARPRPVRIYADRVELCFSWQVVIVAVLAFLAIMLVFFRLGRISAPKTVDGSIVAEKPYIAAVKPDLPKPDSTQPAKIVYSPKMVEPMGDNVIVIASYNINSHLEPVKAYFARFGIETRIIKTASRYLLVTARGFDNPEKPGTDGYEMKKKIIAIGANYKPPDGSGFESFGPKPFQDAYGMKLDN